MAEFCGQTFVPPESFGAMAMMRFSKAASEGVDTDSMEGMAALHDVLKQCIRPEDWAKFNTLADEHRVSEEGLLEFFGEVMAEIADRPTERSSDSSDGPQTIEPFSTADSSSRVISRLEQQGRPDLALMVVRAQESQVS